MKKHKIITKNRIITFAFFFIFFPVVSYLTILILRMLYNHFFVPFVILFSIYVVFGTLLFILAAYLFWRFVLGNFALKYRPSLIPYFFKNKKDKKSFEVTENYFLGKYYFDRADYQRADNYFTDALKPFFYKKIALDELKKHSQLYNNGIKEELKIKVDKLYNDNNDFIAFFKTVKLYFSQFINTAAEGIDYFVLIEQEPIIFFIKNRKIISTKYEFLQDFDEDKRRFIENNKDLFEGENLTEEQKEAKRLNDLRSGFDGSVDFRCIEAKLMLEYNEYAYYEKSLEISNEIVDIVEKSTNQTILWRLLYVRGFAYHKLGDADLACQDWKRGIELGDLEFSQKMYNEHCKKF